MRDEDRGEVAQVGEIVGERPGVDEDPGVGDLGEEAGVAEVGDPHAPTVCRPPG